MHTIASATLFALRRLGEAHAEFAAQPTSVRFRSLQAWMLTYQQLTFCGSPSSVEKTPGLLKALDDCQRTDGWHDLVCQHLLGMTAEAALAS